MLPTAMVVNYPNPVGLEAFCGEWLRSLIDYDCQHGAEMVRTLADLSDPETRLHLKLATRAQAALEIVRGEA